jgi:hypothetical protein
MRPERMSKPVYAYIAGFSAPGEDDGPCRRSSPAFGHGLAKKEASGRCRSRSDDACRGRPHVAER